MATTGNLMGLLAAEARRKRSRVEEEEPENLPQLPVEMQLRIIERVESGQREVVPGPPSRLIEAAEIWRKVYENWKAGRATKMEHPPKLITLDTARLFVSPRFKFVTEMQGSVAQEILKAYAKAMEAELPKSPRFPVLMLYRSEPRAWGDKWEWRISLLTGIRRNEEGFIVFESLGTKFGGGLGEDAAIRFVNTKTVFAGHDAKITIIDWDEDPESEDPDDAIHVIDALIYGQTHYHPLRPLSRDEVLERLRMAGALFWIDAVRFDRPTLGMLAWRDKIVVVRAAARPAYIRAGEATYHTLSSEIASMQIDVFFYREPESSDPVRKISVSVDTFSFSDPSIERVSDDALSQARMVLASEGPHSVGTLLALTAGRIREEVIWANGTRLELSDWKESVGKRTFAIPKDEPALEVIQARVAELPEPALESFAKHREEWGYEMSTWIPSMSSGKLDDPDVHGMLIMPAPWFFYLATGKVDDDINFDVLDFNGHFALAKTAFWFRPHTAMLLTNNSSHIYAHQTHDLIFLPDDIDNVFVEDLTLLQRKGIEERATAPLVKEIVNGVELL